MALKTMAAIAVRPRAGRWLGADLGRGPRDRRVQPRPHFVPACLHVAGDGFDAVQELRTGCGCHHGGIGPASGHVRSLIGALDDRFPDSASSTGSGPVAAHRRIRRPSRGSESRASMKRARPETTRRHRRRRQSPLSGPAIQGPTTLLSPSSPWDGDSGSPQYTSTASAGRVRRASLERALKPFLDDSNANELIYPNKADRPWRYIVLHHSAAAKGNYDQIDAEHRKILGIDGCGYHFVIGNGNGSGDGQIEVSRRWANQKQGVHCRNARTHDVDEYGIGICLVGDFDKNPPTPRQIAAAKALIAYLSTRYNIAQTRVADPRPPGRDQDRLPGAAFPGQRDSRVSRRTRRKASVRFAQRGKSSAK